MPEPAHVSFQLNLAERLQVFAKQTSWENLKAIFVGRKVTTADPVINLLMQRSTTGSHKALNPTNEKKALLQRKAEAFNDGLATDLPKADKTAWKDNRPEGARSLGGRHGLEQADEAVKLVHLGKWKALDSMLSKFDSDNKADEDEFLRVRDHLLNCGLMYPWVDAQGKRHKGASAVFQQHSQRFDGPLTRQCKQMAESPGANLQSHLEQHFSEQEDFEDLRVNLFNSGYFTNPRVREHMMTCSTEFDEEAVKTAKDMLLDHNINEFKQHVQTHFTNSEALAGLIQNLDDNGFLFVESMTPVHPHADLEHARPVKTFLNDLYSKQCAVEVEQKKLAALGGNNHNDIKYWLSENTSTREDLEHLLIEMTGTTKYSQLAQQTVERAYKDDKEEELLTPTLEAEKAFAASTAANEAREQYLTLLAESENSVDKYAGLKALQINLAKESAELQTLRKQLIEGNTFKGIDGAITVLSTPVSHAEIKELLEGIQDEGRDGYDPVAAGVTARCLKTIKDDYEDTMINDMLDLLVDKKYQSLRQYVSEIPQQELKEDVLEALKQEVQRVRQPWRGFQTSSLKFLNTL